MAVRSPIIVVVGHVDHGKSTLLDKIRETKVQKSEAGGMTQCIGATEIPASRIKELSGKLLKQFNIDLVIPGLLAIDTPGHEAFTNLRKRGGSVADLAILVIDVMQGVQPQTKESIEILKEFKVPFVIAANKIDLINGWQPQKTLSFAESFKVQNSFCKEFVQNKVYDFMGKMAEYGITCDLYNKIDDFTKTVAVVPVSGLTGEGLSELLVIVSGLAQKYLSKNLEVTSGSAKGSALEVKESTGLGTVVDAIIYDGILKKNQYLIVGGEDKPIVTKIRALLKPCALQEIRDKKCCFENKDEAVAAAVVRISAPELEKAVSGMPLESAETLKEAQAAAKRMGQEIMNVMAPLSSEGIVLKADNVGSIEALNVFLKKSGISVCKNGIGAVNKKDVIDAVNMKEKNLYYGVIMGFNVKINDDARLLAEKGRINIITSNIIYHLLSEYDKWRNEIMEEKKRDALNSVVLPAKIQVLSDFVFRKSKPAVVGVDVLAGTLRAGADLMNEAGKVIGSVKQLQDSGVTVPAAKEGARLACSIDGAAYEKDFNGQEILYTSVPEKDFIKMKRELKSFLTKNELNTLNEIVAIKRKQLITWGLGG